jgi:hypothetical protein
MKKPNLTTRREFLKQLALAGASVPFLPNLIRKSFAQASPGPRKVLINICVRNGWCPEATVPGIGQVSNLLTNSAYMLRSAPLRVNNAANGFDMLDVPGISSVLPNIVVAAGLDGKPTGHDDFSSLGAVYRNRSESLDQVLANHIYTCQPPLRVLNISNPDVFNTGQSVLNGQAQPLAWEPKVIHKKISNQIALSATNEARTSLDLAANETQKIISRMPDSDRPDIEAYANYLSQLNSQISQMCAVPLNAMGPAPSEFNREQIDAIADIHTELIRLAILAGVQVINVYVQRSSFQTGQGAHSLSHIGDYSNPKRDHFKWIFQKYFVDLASKVSSISVDRGMVLVSNEIGIRDSMHGRWGHVYPAYVWGANQPWQLNAQGRILNFQDTRKPLAPQSAFPYGALAVQYFTTVMDFFGVSTSAYEQNGHRGFGDGSTSPTEDSVYSAIMPLLRNTLPGFRNS